MVEPSIAHDVSAVLGVENLTSAHTDIQFPHSGLRNSVARAQAPASVAGAPNACSDAVTRAEADGGWTESEIAQAYGLTKLYARGGLGRGESIAILELEPFERSDLTTFDRCYFGYSHTTAVSISRVDGFKLSGSGEGESLLDIEVIAALAPDAMLDVYDAPNTSLGPIDAYNAMVSDDRANFISTSWGECETAAQVGAPGTQQVENYLFEEAATQGQSVFSASGDTGSDDCAGTQFSSSQAEPPYLSVDDPASQPYVVGVGGTSLRSDRQPLGAPDEQVWNDGAGGGGGGGGISNSWPSPPWQSDSGVPGTSAAPGRLVPDVSASADENHGVTIYSASFASGSSGTSQNVASGWSTIGGTSIAAPIWAATAADIASSNVAGCGSLPVRAGGRDLGFLGPELYEVASKSYATTFNDVTLGDNDVFGLHLGYTAHAGFNLASGLGSPIVTDADGSGGLASALCGVAGGDPLSWPSPTISGLSQPAGPTTGGNALVLTGTGFEPSTHSSVQVWFGNAKATVDAASDTSITVTVPASSPAPSSPSVDAAGRVDVIATVSNGVLSASSATSAATQYEYLDEQSTASALPSVSATGPSGGNASGGNTVVIYGSGFASSAVKTVTFGGVTAPSFKVDGPTEITAVVPPEGAGTICASGVGFEPSAVCQVQVVVTTENGASTTAAILPPLTGDVVFGPQGVLKPVAGSEDSPAASEYDYAPTPVVTSISPDPARDGGNNPVTIYGSGFSVLTFDWVNFGPPAAVESEQTKIVSISPTSVSIAPPGMSVVGPSVASLAGGVSIQTLAGLSNAAAFGYAGVPVVTGLSASGGPASGGERLRLSGRGLSDVTSVQFRPELAGREVVATGSSIVRAARHLLTVVVPPAAPGPYAVVPCSIEKCATPDDSIGTFVYFRRHSATVVAVSPDFGPAAGGTPVVIFGDGVVRASSARFGGSQAPVLEPDANFPGNSDVVIAVSPPSAAGRVRVTLQFSGEARSTSAVFTYRPSAPSAPRDVSVTGDTVSWRAPMTDGGSPVTAYLIVASSPGGTRKQWSVAPDETSLVLGDLRSDHRYSLSIAAENARFGLGPPAAASFVAR